MSPCTSTRCRRPSRCQSRRRPVRPSRPSTSGGTWSGTRSRCRRCSRTFRSTIRFRSSLLSRAIETLVPLPGCPSGSGPTHVLDSRSDCGSSKAALGQQMNHGPHHHRGSPTPSGLWPSDCLAVLTFIRYEASILCSSPCKYVFSIPRPFRVDGLSSGQPGLGFFPFHFLCLVFSWGKKRGVLLGLEMKSHLRGGRLLSFLQNTG